MSSSRLNPVSDSSSTATSKNIRPCYCEGLNERRLEKPAHFDHNSYIFEQKPRTDSAYALAALPQHKAIRNLAKRADSL